MYKPHTTHNSSIRSDEGLTLETSASESLYSGQFTLSTQLIKPNYHCETVHSYALYKQYSYVKFTMYENWPAGTPGSSKSFNWDTSLYIIEDTAPISGVTATIPVPGLSFAVDTGLVLKEVIFYRTQLGLPETGSAEYAKLHLTTKEKVLSFGRTIGSHAEFPGGNFRGPGFNGSPDY